MKFQSGAESPRSPHTASQAAWTGRPLVLKTCPSLSGAGGGQFQTTRLPRGLGAAAEPEVLGGRHPAPRC